MADARETRSRWETLSPHRLERRFREAKPPLGPDQAVAEANRCLFCYDAPCIDACPTHIDVPRFIRRIAQGNLDGAARTILERNLLGYSCGRHCPVEVLCEGACVYQGWNQKPIQIGRLQRFATEHVLPGRDDAGSVTFPKAVFARPRAARGSVALVGSGPASLSCGGYLTLHGHRAVLFEKREWPGGLNTWGIASYKLQADDAFREIAFVESLGLEIRSGVEVGVDLEAATLLEEHDYVFLGLGLGIDSWLDVPGMVGPGVLGAVEIIQKLKLEEGYSVEGIERAYVIGGGNTAMDVCSQLAGLGVPQVTLVYRRSEAKLKAYRHEWSRARSLGVRLLAETLPRAVHREGGTIRGLELVRAQAGRPTGPSLGEHPADLVVLATGQERNFELARSFPGVDWEDGRIVIDEAGRTGNPRVFSGGDCANGGREVVDAVADGRRAAEAIHELLAASRKEDHA